MFGVLRGPLVVLPIALGVLLSAAGAQPDPVGRGRAVSSGPKVARIQTMAGAVYLQNRGGKPMVIPKVFDLAEGDIITTSEQAAGKFTLTAGGEVPLAPLRRYRVGRNAIYEPAGPKGWRQIPGSMEAAPKVAALGPPTIGGLLAKARVIASPVFRRAEGWPQELMVRDSVSIGAGDDLRVGTGGRTQVLFASGGFLNIVGPALVTFLPDRLVIDSGEGMAKGLGDREVMFGPYRVEPGDNVFTFQTIPDGLVIGALGGIIPIRETDTHPLLLAPGRRGVLCRGREPQLSRLDIRKEALRYEALLGSSRAAPSPRTSALPRERPAMKEPAPAKAEKRTRTKARVESSWGNGTTGDDGGATRATLPLRDRLKALDSPESRYFYAKKRAEREAKIERETYARSVGDKQVDEVTSLKLYKLDRAREHSHRELNEYRNAREMTFEERLDLGGPDRDQAVRAERERLFGQPLWLLTRRLRPGVEGDRDRAIRQADQLTLQIRILQQTGGSASAVAELERRRQDVLEQADRESDALKEQNRIQLEPYR